jgi:hypothetical protein
LKGFGEIFNDAHLEIFFVLFIFFAAFYFVVAQRFKHLFLTILALGPDFVALSDKLVKPLFIHLLRFQKSSLICDEGWILENLAQT